MQEENTERTFQLELEQAELLKVLSMAAWDEKTVSELHTCYSAAEPATVRDCSALRLQEHWKVSLFSYFAYRKVKRPLLI